MDTYPDVWDQSACVVTGGIFIGVCSCPSEGEVAWKLLLWCARSCEVRGVVAAMSWLLLEDWYGSETTHRTVVRSELLYPALEDPESTVNRKLSKIPINRLTPNDPYMGRTAPLTSKRCILYIYSTNIGTEYFKHALYSPFFYLQLQFVS